MANDMTFTQVATVLKSIADQATGTSTIQAVDTKTFVSVAQTALKTGYDPVINAINQVLSSTLFSIRPYSEKFKGMEMSGTAFGNHVRKLKIASADPSEDDRYKWPVAYDSSKSPASGDGKSVDQYIIRKPNVLQTNFYGQNVYSDYYTLFRDQFDVAFSSPEEFQRFVQMITQDGVNRQTKWREEMKRATLLNLIGGILIENNNDRVIHCITEYNTLTGLNMTEQTVYQPDNFAPFVRWLYSRVATISDMMTERSIMFQTNITGKNVQQHTPVQDQRIYLYSPIMRQFETMVKSDTYHDNLLTMAETEAVNFWQSIETPDSIACKPAYTNTSGAVVNASNQVEQAGILGVIMDKEACGMTVTQAWSAPTPFNARGGYTNYWYHNTLRNFTDNTEKAVVLLLD